VFVAQRRLCRSIDQDRVRKAIQEAEGLSSGEIVVSVAPYFWGDVPKAARRAFERLGVGRTRRRNGVLFFIVPSRRRLVVLGDEGIHARVEPGFWDGVVATVTSGFRKGDFSLGLLAGIEAVAAVLRAHFPREPGDVNELPDEPDFGSKGPM